MNMFAQKIVHLSIYEQKRMISINKLSRVAIYSISTCQHLV